MNQKLYNRLMEVILGSGCSTDEVMETVFQLANDLEDDLFASEVEVLNVV
jgi:hypothetical protein